MEGTFPRIASNVCSLLSNQCQVCGVGGQNSYVLHRNLFFFSFYFIFRFLRRINLSITFTSFTILLFLCIISQEGTHKKCKRRLESRVNARLFVVACLHLFYFIFFLFNASFKLGECLYNQNAGVCSVDFYMHCPKRPFRSFDDGLAKFPVKRSRNLFSFQQFCSRQRIPVTFAVENNVVHLLVN